MNKYKIDQIIEFQSFKADNLWKRGIIGKVVFVKGEISYVVIGDDGQRTFREEHQIRGQNEL